jgi:hypothetical protein
MPTWLHSLLSDRFSFPLEGTARWPHRNLPPIRSSGSILNIRSKKHTTRNPFKTKKIISYKRTFMTIFESLICIGANRAFCDASKIIAIAIALFYAILPRVSDLTVTLTNRIELPYLSRHADASFVAMAKTLLILTERRKIFRALDFSKISFWRLIHFPWSLTNDE